MSAKRVLIVDSEADFASALQGQFEGAGCEVEVLGDGQSGLKRIMDGELDLVLLAVEIPKKNGYSVCNKVKKTKKVKDIPLVIMSADATEDTFEQHKKLKWRAEEYLKKPFPVDSVLDVVGSLIELSGGGMAAIEEEEEVLAGVPVEEEADADGPSIEDELEGLDLEDEEEFQLDDDSLEELSVGDEGEGDDFGLSEDEIGLSDEDFGLDEESADAAPAKEESPPTIDGEDAVPGLDAEFDMSLDDDSAWADSDGVEPGDATSVQVPPSAAPLEFQDDEADAALAALEEHLGDAALGGTDESESIFEEGPGAEEVVEGEEVFEVDEEEEPPTEVVETPPMEEAEAPPAEVVVEKIAEDAPAAASSADLAKLKSKVKRLEKANVELKQKLVDREKEYFEAREGRDAQASEVDGLQAQLQEVQTDLDATKAELEDARGEIQAAKENAKSAERELKDTRAQLEGELEETRGQLDESIQTRQQLEDDLGDAKSAAADAQSLAADLENDLGGARDEIGVLEDRLKRTETARDDAEKGKADAEAEADRLNTDLDATKGDLDATRGELEAREGELTSARERISELEDNLQAEQERASDLEAELGSEIEQLKESEAELRQELEDAQGQVKKNEERAVRYAHRIRADEAARDKAKKALGIAMQLLADQQEK